MREILFRGKRKDNDEWVYGAYIHYDDTQGKGKDDCDYIVQKHNGQHFPFVNATPESIGQYTGLTDKNGTRIFEHDIVRNEYETNKYQYLFVKWDNKSFSWIVENKYGWAGKLGNIIGLTEIIGNIFDNPELLKGGAEE